MSKEEKTLRYKSIETETPMAILFNLNEKEQVWLPKSEAMFNESEKTITLPHWLTPKITRK